MLYRDVVEVSAQKTKCHGVKTKKTSGVAVRDVEGRFC